MLYFTIWWTFGTSICCIITALIFRQSKKNDSNDSTISMFASLIIYWFLSGLVQWQILNFYISNARIWGITTTIGGLCSSILLILLLGYTMHNLCKNVSFALGTSDPNIWKFWLFISVSIIFIFGTGFLLGWEQSLVLQHSRSLSYFNSIIPLITLPLLTGAIWLLFIPILEAILSMADINFYTYIFIIIITTIVMNSIKGLLIGEFLLFSN